MILRGKFSPRRKALLALVLIVFKWARSGFRA